MNFQEFFNNLTTNHPATSTNRKDTYGYIWETKVCKWFLKNSPYWKTQFKPESIMSPEEWGYGIKSSDTGAILIQDIGIDLVAEHVDGTMWGIQAKCYTRPIPTTEIESFITALGLKWVDVNNPNSTKELQNGLLLITNQISRTIHPDISNPFLSPDDFFIAGWTIWQGERLAITLWGDDSTSEMKDGFSNNEFIHWGVFKENINYPFLRPSPVKLIYRVGKNQWQPNGISIIDSLKIDLTKSWCFE